MPRKRQTDNIKIGHKFEKLTVVEYVDGIYFLCDCECGKKKHKVYGYNLVKKLAKSCGCNRNKQKRYIKINERFHSLTVINDKLIKNTILVRCDCGTEKYVGKQDLITESTKTCGCGIGLNRARTHGQTKSITYQSWCHMRQRCNNPNNHAFKWYGGRGIKICERWNKYENFLDDMGDRPSNKYSIDRLNPNDDYKPENCRWATAKEQGQTTTTNRFIEYNGERLTVKQWSEKLNIPPNTLQERISKGWPIHLALTLRPNKGRKHTDYL